MLPQLRRWRNLKQIPQFSADTALNVARVKLLLRRALHQPKQLPVESLGTVLDTLATCFKNVGEWDIDYHLPPLGLPPNTWVAGWPQATRGMPQ